jgi:hypothetical protein
MPRRRSIKMFRLSHRTLACVFTWRSGLYPPILRVTASLMTAIARPYGAEARWHCAPQARFVAGGLRMPPPVATTARGSGWNSRPLIHRRASITASQPPPALRSARPHASVAVCRQRDRRRYQDKMPGAKRRRLCRVRLVGTNRESARLANPLHTPKRRHAAIRAILRHRGYAGVLGHGCDADLTVVLDDSPECGSRPL